MVIVGPTAAGKSAGAMAVCEALGGEIISADSVQVYRGLDIGSAKATAEEQGRIPHHAIDLVTPQETMDAARWLRAAEEAIEGIQARNKLPVVCGGTGMYVQSLLYGLAQVPEIPDDVRSAVRGELEDTGPERLHEELTRVDAEAAGRIGPRDGQRIGRALEVHRASGRPLSAWQREGRESAPRWSATVVGIWPEREALYERIDQRVDQMLETGWIGEVAGLLSRGIPPDAPGLQTLGYRDVVASVQGVGPTSGLEVRIAQGHRQYARRQLTWFRRMDRQGDLVHLEGAAEDIEQALMTLGEICLTGP